MKSKKIKKQKNKKRSKKFITISGLIIIIILLGGGYYLRSILIKPTDIEEPLNIPVNNQQTNSASSKPMSAPAPSTPAHDYVIPQIQNGLTPVISSIPTKEPLVFLGIDDGIYKLPEDVQIMKENNVVASLFLVKRFVQDNTGFFSTIINNGSLIENHTLDHDTLTNLTYDQQKEEICGGADWLSQIYGRRPILFRPPGGSYNELTQQAAAACGMRAVVLWVAKANGGSMQYQIGNKLRPGDIVLMHFRPEFKQDMQAFINAEKLAGLHTDLLENWLN